MNNLGMFKVFIENEFTGKLSESTPKFLIEQYFQDQKNWKVKLWCDSARELSFKTTKPNPDI